ncbi:hypothetical protein GRI38_00125 [Altererythrobacter aurantiacus]|uniref:Uncharacterized protein n=1 Tax=Parapontixanthobacter aurantiacus TaxID=1463599 RepID=A0A844ZA97_9SPHN|nr:hypothetical protein [Parapontixanthobacter aurantiacus]MXO84444.1 hypothetical protein [Parapontixanthobacter aurantiacus]
MELAIYALDVTIVVAAVLSAWFWLQAAGKPQRRVSKFEDFNHADLNRLVTALNRARILNARAALATAIAALLGGLRIALDLLP